MCSLVGSSCAEGSRRTTSTTTPKCGPTIEEQGQLAGGCARSGRSGDGWVENTLLSMQTRARAHALSTSYELLLLVERLDVHRDGSLSTTRLSKIKKRERRVSKTKSYLHALLLGRVGNITNGVESIDLSLEIYTVRNHGVGVSVSPHSSTST